MTDTSWMQTADLAAGRGALGIGLVMAAVVVVALLIGMFALGSRRVRDNRTRRPRPEEQPRMPGGGPVREVRERRTPDEVPRSDEHLTPHELNGNAGRTSTPQERPRRDDNSSGSFGSGGH